MTVFDASFNTQLRCAKCYAFSVLLSQAWIVTRRNQVSGDHVQWLAEKARATFSTNQRRTKKGTDTIVFPRFTPAPCIFLGIDCFVWISVSVVMGWGQGCLVEENCWETIYGYRVLKFNLFVFKVAFFRKMPHRPEHVNEQAWEPSCRVQLLDKTLGFGFEVKCFL